MKFFIIYLTLFFFSIGNIYAEKEPIPDDHKWGQSGDRENNSPQLYQDDTYVYVYSEKQLDNLYIGITDMLGNVFYEETTTVPAGQYYAIPISSLPDGTYYLSIIQGSNYVIGIFSK
ncbi:MAG: DUF3244 domain-containing protein [Bacteroidaceae bacterium]|nr:DUF3244 domain-containing protein [Bacteroidaceae bacterium]